MFQLSKRTIIFLVLFSVILLGITIGAIIYSNSHNVSDSSEVVIEGEISKKTKSKESLIDDGVKGIKLDDKYNVNDLKITETTYNPSENSEFNIIYCQISGLKDESVQNKINQEIKDKVFDSYDNLKNSRSNINQIVIRATCVASFSDVLSIEVNSFINYGDKKIESSWDGLNYRLDTGEKIKFKDLFTYNTGIKNILTSELYKNMAWGYSSYTSEGEVYDFEHDMNKIDYQDLEEKVYNFVYEYTKNDNSKFSFTENTINLTNGENIYNISMYDYYENIAIYNRFVSSESLYKNDIYELNNIPVLTDVYSPGHYSMYYQDDNCNVFFETWDDKDYGFYKFEILEIIDQIKKECADQGKSIYYEASISYNEKEDKIEVGRQEYKYSSDKKNYKDYVYDIINDQKRKGSWNAVNHYYEVDERYVTKETNYTKSYYDKEKKERIDQEEKKTESNNNEHNKVENNIDNTIDNNHTSGVNSNNADNNDTTVVNVNSNSSNTTNTTNNTNTTGQDSVVDTIITIE